MDIEKIASVIEKNSIEYHTGLFEGMRYRKVRTMRATVKWYNDSRGYGFLTSDTEKEIFVHYTSIMGDGFKTLYKEQQVECEVIDGPKGPIAFNVIKVKQ